MQIAIESKERRRDSCTVGVTVRTKKKSQSVSERVETRKQELQGRGSYRNGDTKDSPNKETEEVQKQISSKKVLLNGRERKILKLRLVS